MDPIVNITLSTGPTYAWQNAKLWQDANQRASIFAQFWSKVQRADAKACWLWTGHVSDRGYGIFWLPLGPDAQRVRAHRFAWIASRGDIPDGLEVCHRCDVTRCVNPDHLFLGTRLDNHLDSVRKGRKRAWGLQKLNAAQVHDIRARAATGELHRLIAADYGVSRNTVSQIATRTTWAHLRDGSAGARQAS
jgi:hypothetical protein